MHDPVERGLHIARQPPLAEGGAEVDADVRLLGERVDQPLQRGHETEVVEHGGAQLDGEAAHVLERADDLLSEVAKRVAGRVVCERLLERL